MPNFIKIGPVAEIAIFYFTRWRPVAVLDFKFLISEILTAGNMPNQSSGCGHVAIFRFFKMAASRHLGFSNYLNGLHYPGVPDATFYSSTHMHTTVLWLSGFCPSTCEFCSSQQNPLSCWHITM